MNRCEGCELSRLGNKYRVCIPPPSDKIRGCIISRDPTKDFLGDFENYRQLSADERENFYFNAPPLWLYEKIGDFMNLNENSQKMRKLHTFLDRQCYWTHLHKCPTCKPGINQDQNQNGIRDVNEYFPPFQYPIATSCANRWFESEFDKYGLKDKIIINCGRHVEKFFNQWSKQHLGENDRPIINLPHPSGANCGNGWSWNKNTNYTERITSEINRLLNLI